MASYDLIDQRERPLRRKSLPTNADAEGFSFLPGLPADPPPEPKHNGRVSASTSPRRATTQSWKGFLTHSKPQGALEAVDESQSDSRNQKTRTISGRRLWWSATFQRGNDLWLPEIGCLLVSVAAIIGIIIVLKTVDGRPLSSWTHTLQITTVISFLAILSKSSMVMVASSVIGQHKWNVYADRSKFRILTDFYKVDGASNGPLGALALLLSSRRPDLATILAVLTIAAIASEPFVQQSVKLRLHNLDVNVNATVPISSYYQQWQPGPIEAIKRPELPMMAAMYDGLLNYDTSAINPVRASCNTGNCTFPPYATLSVCNKCVNVTHKMRQICDGTGTAQSCYYTLPNGLEAGTGVYLNASSTAAVNNTNDLLDLDLPYYLTLSSIGRTDFFERDPDGFAGPVTAMDCMVFGCVTTYRASVEQGLFTEELQSVLPLKLPADLATDIKNWSLSLPRALYDTMQPGSPREYIMESFTTTALQTYLTEQVNGSIYGGSGAGENDWSSDIALALWANGGGMCGYTPSEGDFGCTTNVSVYNISIVLDNMALAMSNSIRRASGEVATGLMTSIVTFVEVHWA